MFLFYGILAWGPWCFVMLWTPVPVSSIKRQWMPSWFWGAEVLVPDMARKTQFWCSKGVFFSEPLQEWCLLILGLSLGNNFLQVPDHLSMTGLLTCSRAGGQLDEPVIQHSLVTGEMSCHRWSRVCHCDPRGQDFWNLIEQGNTL